jgi:hypothetical protein
MRSNKRERLQNLKKEWMHISNMNTKPNMMLLNTQGLGFFASVFQKLNVLRKLTKSWKTTNLPGGWVSIAEIYKYLSANGN